MRDDGAYFSRSVRLDSNVTVRLSFGAVGADTLEWNKGADGDAVRLVSLQRSMRVFTVHVAMAGVGLP